MTGPLPALILAALALAPLPAAAKGPAHCPPGLAKKTPACVPPGQAKTWRAGDRYDGPWDSAPWWRYGLPRPARDETWIRVTDDMIVRVNDDTRAIVEILRLAGAILSD